MVAAANDAEDNALMPHHFLRFALVVLLRQDAPHTRRTRRLQPRRYEEYRPRDVLVQALRSVRRMRGRSIATSTSPSGTRRNLFRLLAPAPGEEPFDLHHARLVRVRQLPKLDDDGVQIAILASLSMWKPEIPATPVPLGALRPADPPPPARARGASSTRSR